MSRAESKLIVYVLAIGIPIYFINKLFENIDFLTVALVSLFLFIVYGISKYNERKSRKLFLLDKYKDKKLVDDLMNGFFWQGQTAEQLIDSLGEPEDIDQKVLKTKKKEVWKYEHLGSNRYGLRVTLDNDIVIGWDKKN